MSGKEEEILLAIENGTYKFASQQCAKLIKKSPNVTYYQILNNYILLESGKTEEAIKSSLEIMERVPNDVKSLSLLNTIFNQVGKTTEALQVYENAAKKYPSFDILTKWFHLGCEESDLKILQKGSMALKGFHPSQRLFNLWAGFTYYLSSIDPNANTIEKGLFPKLGLKIIESLKPFRNEQEVYVMAKLLKLNGLLQKIPVEILEFNGVENKLDLELQIILLDTFNEANDYKNLFKWSFTVLRDYKIDDFNTWKYLIKSGSELGKDVKSIIEEYGETRNSLLSRIELDSYQSRDLLPSIQEYFTKFGSKPCAFYDLTHYFSRINNADFIDWLTEQPVPSIKSKAMVWELNILKFQLLSNKSLLTSEDFISTTISKYIHYKDLLQSKTKTDLFEGDEFVLLIIQSILSQRFDTSNIIKSIIILESVIIKDEHEFHLRLWLVQLYTLLNCSSQANHHYDSLGIKNIQYNILDHFLLSRYGTTSPNDRVLSKHFENYEKMELEGVYYLKIGFNKGVFNKLGGIIELNKSFRLSGLKRHELIQGLIIGRIFNDKDVSAFYKKELKAFEIASRGRKTVDNRDFKIFWNFGINEDFGLSKRIFKNIPIDTEIDDGLILKEKLINEESKELLSFPIEKFEGTEAEKWSIEVLTSFYKILSKEAPLSKLQELYTVGTPKIPTYPSWETSHIIITLIDTTKIIQSLIGANFKNGNKKELSELKELNITLLEGLREDSILAAKDQASKSLKAFKSNLQHDQDLKGLEIREETIDKIFEIIEYSNNESFKLLRIL